MRRRVKKRTVAPRAKPVAKPFGKLGAPQVAEALALRRHGASWRAIAQRYRVDAKTVRRYCDPTFLHESNGRNEFLGYREALDEHHRRMWGDLQFKCRVLAICRAGASEAKHFTPGVVRRSGTTHARRISRPPERFGDCVLADLAEPSG